MGCTTTQPIESTIHNPHFTKNSILGEKMAKKKDERSKNWTCIIYPESVLENWKDIIEEQHIEWVESPLHDKDLYADGTPKKAHQHILLCFSSNKSNEQIAEFTASFNGTIPQPCRNLKGMVRYFAHMDSPEKAQYDIKDIIAHGGMSIDSYLSIGKIDRHAILKDMISYIRENHVTNFSDFTNYCMTEKYDAWFSLLCDNSTILIKEIIKSEWLKSKDCLTYSKAKENLIQSAMENKD